VAALLLVLLLAPADGLIWSKAHGICVRIPDTWKITDRDREQRAFVVEGPQLGPGVPHLVVWNAGEGAGTLAAKTDGIVADLEKRPGWRVTARVPKRVGPWPAVRLGVRFVDEGRKGQARVTVLRLGDRFVVLEMSAAASHFPAAIYDRIEASLDVKWSEQTLPGGLRTEVPAGWAARVEAGRLTVQAPLATERPCVLFLARADAPEAPGDAGPKVRFLGQARATVQEEREVGELRVRMVRLQVEGWSAVVMMPVDAWDEAFPVMEEILARASLPPAK